MNEKILIVDDEKLIRMTLSKTLRGWGFVPLEAENKSRALELFEIESPDVTLLDINLPDGSGLHVLREIKRRQPDAIVIMITANVLNDDAIADLRGAYDFIGKPVNLDEIHQTILNGLEMRRLRREVRTLRTVKEIDFNFDQIIGDSQVMKAVKEQARKVAESNVANILLQGESGTGKDLFARAIHFSSNRSHNPFVTINCAAIPSTLIESELFGYEKGAFTDAKARKEGLFEQAMGGTIFLDEIGELELGLQAKLLRVLEEGRFRRVGGLRDLPLDVRVVSASNRDIRQDSEFGRFRLDLYYRLSVIQLNIPPLRDRGEDILKLADYFLNSIDRSEKKPRRLSKQVEQAFRHYHWKGNVRELKNAIERALILGEGDEITLHFLPPEISHSNDLYSLEVQKASAINDLRRFITFPPEGLPLDELISLLIESAIEQTGGNVTQASALLGVSRDRLRYFLKKNGLEQKKKKINN